MADSKPARKRSSSSTKGKAPRKKRSAIRRLFGFRADGGPVTAGGAYFVGERGPELFRPAVSGRIESVPGGRGRIASIVRAPSRALAGLGRVRQGKLSKGGRSLPVGLLAGAAGAGLAKIFDQMGVSDIVAGGIFAGIAVGLAAIGQTFASVAMIGVAGYELVQFAWDWFKKKYPDEAAAVPIIGGSAAPTPAPAR